MDCSYYPFGQSQMNGVQDTQVKVVLDPVSVLGLQMNIGQLDTPANVTHVTAIPKSLASYNGLIDHTTVKQDSL